MALQKEVKNKIIKDFQINSQDTGSAEVQIALLTEDIRSLTGHFQSNAKDFNSKMGLLKKVSLRRRLLRYLAKENQEKYKAILERLGLKK